MNRGLNLTLIYGSDHPEEKPENETKWFEQCAKECFERIGRNDIDINAKSTNGVMSPLCAFYLVSLQDIFTPKRALEKYLAIEQDKILLKKELKKVIKRIYDWNLRINPVHFDLYNMVVPYHMPLLAKYSINTFNFDKETCEDKVEETVKANQSDKAPESDKAVDSNKAKKSVNAEESTKTTEPRQVKNSAKDEEPVKTDERNKAKESANKNEANVWERYVVNLQGTFPDMFYMVAKKIPFFGVRKYEWIAREYKRFPSILINVAMLGLLPKGKKYGGYVKVLLHNTFVENRICVSMEAALAYGLNFFMNGFVAQDKRVEWFEKLELTEDDCAVWSEVFNQKFPDYVDVHKIFAQLA